MTSTPTPPSPSPRPTPQPSSPKPSGDPQPTTQQMSTRDTLLHYSEWLDSQGVIRPDEESHPHHAVERSHDELAQEFIAHWEADERGASLAGR